MILTKTRISLGLLGLAILWWYVPPIGSEVERPDLESFFEPGVPHGQPVFIQAGDEVYYRVRLHRPVLPWFAWTTYLDTLRKRGVQFRENTTSPHVPFKRRKGWEIALAREKELDPYTIEYWKIRVKGGSIPTSMAWPWLFVRLGPEVLQAPHTAVLTPKEDVATLAAAVPRYPGSVLTEAAREQWRITLEFWAEATPQEIMEFYSGVLQQDVTSQLEEHPLFIQLDSARAAASGLCSSKFLQVEVNNMIYSDGPLVVYPAGREPTSLIYEQQPETLKHLPPVSRYLLNIHYPSPELAEQAFRQLVHPKGNPR